MPEVQDPLSFGDLKTDLADMLERGRDSTLSDRILGRAVNAAEQHICNELGGYAKFLQDTETITIPANETEYTFRTQVKDVISLRDTANLWKLAYVDREMFNNSIVSASFSTGDPLYWTKFGYERRSNQESPQQQYGQFKIELTPQTTGDKTLEADEILRAGYMVDDEDMPVVPSEYHWDLLEVAASHLSPRVVGQKAFSEFRELAARAVERIRRAEIRDLAGNQRIVPREAYERASGRNSTVTPPTRFAQLYGGN